MKRLFFHKTLHFLKQLKSQVKCDLRNLKILNDFSQDKKDIDGTMMNQIRSKNTENPFLKNQKLNLNFEQLKQIDYLLKSQLKVENPQSNQYLRLKWIRQLLLILFLTKLLENQNIYCDYDINDMMITIELQERLLSEEQQNEKHDKEQRQKSQPKKKKKRRSTIKLKGQTKDERYGTVEEMLKDQMQSSEQFRSVEQRLMFKQQQQNKNKSIEENQDSQKQATNINGHEAKKDNDENIASVVFKQDIKIEPVSKTQQNKQQTQQIQTQDALQQNFENLENVSLDEGKQDNKLEQGTFTSSPSQISAQTDEQKVIPTEQPFMSQEKSSQPVEHIAIQENLKQEESISNEILNQVQKQQDRGSIHVAIKETQLTMNQQNPPQQKRENNATLQLFSPQLLSLSKNIQNFLKLRGISVNIETRKYNEEEGSSKNKIHLNLCNKVMDCKDINIQKQTLEFRDVFHHINNFLNPPHILNSIQQAKSLLETLQKDQNIIGSYIPEAQQFQKSRKPISQFDTFSLRYPQPDPVKAEKQFREYKYLSSSKKNCFVIVRDKQVANYLKISTNKIGLPHLLSKYDRQLNGKQSEPNCKINGQFYHMVGNLDKVIDKQKLNTTQKIAQKINQLSQRGFTLINSVQDMYDKIRQLKEQSVSFSFNQQNQQQPKKHKKLFVIKINDQKSENQINSILEKLSKMNKNEVSIVKTQSQMLLKSLGVFSNEQYGTMRLFDLQHRQEPIVLQSANALTKEHYQRYVPNVPFQVEALSRWISNITPFDKSYDEYDRSVNKLSISHPGDFQATNQQGKVKLVLFYKQGCKGCKLMQDLLSRVNELKQKLQSGQTQISKRMKRQICLRYRIQDPEHFKNMQISKFNILNDDQSIEVPQTTPMIYLFNETNKQKVLLKTDQIFNHLNRINTNNGQVVQEHMVRDLIDEIQKANKKIQALY